MKTSDTSEKGFQKLIVRELTEKQGYAENKSNDFDQDFCVIKKSLLEFVKQSQPDSYDFILKKGEHSFFSRLDSKIAKQGIVEVLRKGVKHFDKTIDLFYPKPNSLHNIKDQKRYEDNIFSVTQELHYTGDSRNRLDLVIFLNGLPIITLELKNAFTHQAVLNAIRQYKHDRNPKDRIFHFARCLVHFAADTDLVFMTTHLNGKDTNFIPFNKGLNDGLPFPPFGSGNPLSPHGMKTAYLWEDIFSKESLSDIIEKYVQILTEKDPDTNKSQKKLIFPRCHQLTVVRRLLAHAKEKGVGERYLIQHSAGSGKSNSITWLAHQLTGLYDQSNIHPLFDSVVAVTDRTVLDEQIRKNIKAFAQVKKIVEAVTGNPTDIKALDPSETCFSKTTHMRLALENNKKIIICTVQTFPFVLDAIQEMPGKHIAFIIDEAHSSQSGQGAASMNALFADRNITELPKDEEGNIDTEDLVNYLMENRKMLKNASYFAFTATPKNKTLETFGCRQADGTFKAFHTYSMKQAIEEEFILDVLQNYTTYQSYYKIREKNEMGKHCGISDDDLYETRKAHKKLRNYVEGNELAIAEKSRIMIDHFHENVRHLIKGKARAMVVTKSIEAAMKYKDAFDDYLKEIRSPYKAIVAFSGKKAHYRTGEELSEADMNCFPDRNNDIPGQFKKEPYRFLIAANKFQTGFDQPLLHTMYVDKELSDVQAVQTLSRLNRACRPYKTDTFVLDFFNKTDDIQKAFAPYYTATILSRETDVNKLNDLQDELDKRQIYSDEDIDRFFSLFYSKAERSLLDSIIDSAAAGFEHEDQEEQIKFKSNAKSFVRTYAYLSKLLDFNNPYWEKLWLFLKHLIPKLKVEDDEDEENILTSVDMESYRTHRIGTANIYLNEDENMIDPIPVSTGGGKAEQEYDTLGRIIAEFNKRFGNIDWGDGVDAKEAEQILAGQIPEKMKTDSETLQSIKNSDKDNAKITSDGRILNLMQSLMFTHTGIYKKFMDDSDFRKQYQEFVFDMLWQNVKKGKALDQR